MNPVPEPVDTLWTGTVPATDVAARLVEMAADDAPLRLVEFADVRVTGRLDLSHTTRLPDIRFTRCFFDGPVTMIDSEARSVRFLDCRLSGFQAHGVRVQGDLEITASRRLAVPFAPSSHCRGRIDVSGATIGGDLRLTRTHVDAATGEKAVDMSRARIHGQVFARDLSLAGRLHALGCRVEGTFSIWSGSINAGAGTCLHLERAEIGETLFLKEGFRTRGSVLLSNAVIKGGVDLADARLGKNAAGRSIDAPRLTVGRNFGCHGMQTTGRVHLRGARVEGVINLSGTALGTDGRASLMLSRAQTSRMDLRFARAPLGDVLLEDARTGTLEDDPDVWPEGLALDGFSYDRLVSDPPPSAATRLSWLRRQPTSWRPQPYLMLAGCFERMGQPQDSRRIRLAAERARTGRSGPAGRIWGYFLDLTVGYGFRLWRAALCLVLLAAVCAVPIDAAPVLEVRSGPHPDVNSFVYALDVLLPVVNLHQEEFWLPSAWGQLCTWFLAVAGWLLTAAVVAGAAKIFNR